jgi:hypothetical protein
VRLRHRLRRCGRLVDVDDAVPVHHQSLQNKRVVRFGAACGLSGGERVCVPTVRFRGGDRGDDRRIEHHERLRAVADLDDERRADPACRGPAPGGCGKRCRSDEQRFRFAGARHQRQVHRRVLAGTAGRRWRLRAVWQASAEDGVGEGFSGEGAQGSEEGEVAAQGLAAEVAGGERVRLVEAPGEGERHRQVLADAGTAGLSADEGVEQRNGVVGASGEGEGEGEVVAQRDVVRVVSESVAIDALGVVRLGGHVVGQPEGEVGAGVCGIGVDGGLQFATGLFRLAEGEQGAAVSEAGGGVAGVQREHLSEDACGGVVGARRGGGFGEADERRRVVRREPVRLLVEQGGAGMVAARPNPLRHPHRLRSFDLRSGCNAVAGRQPVAGTTGQDGQQQQRGQPGTTLAPARRHG